MKTSDAVGALSALAHGGRLSIFRLLVQAGPDGVPAGEIARSLDVPPSSLSANLTVLTNADLIANRRDGRSIIYTAQYEAMTELLGFLMEDCCAGSPTICAPLAEVATQIRCATTVI